MRRPILLLATIALALMMAGRVAWAAEGGGAPALAATADESALCQNPQQVFAVGPRDYDMPERTTGFTTNGDAFRVRYEVDFIDDAALYDAVKLDNLNRGGGLVESVTINEDATNSFIVNAPRHV